MREDIEQQLAPSGIDFFTLPLTARLLLVTDGTVTELLEAMLCEPIELGFKDQHPISETHGKQLLRRVVLRGAESKTPWLYAESSIHLSNLNDTMHEQLLTDATPIGMVFKNTNTDSRRKLKQCGKQTNATAAKALEIREDYVFIYRSYQIKQQARILIEVTEWFPYDLIEQQLTAPNQK